MSKSAEYLYLKFSSIDWKRYFILLVGIITFAVIFGIEPIYHSNQNHYFLHGLGKQNYGLLSDDWLFKTIDPFPVFSSMVGFLYSYFGEVAFYLFYLAIAGTYFFCMIGLSLSFLPSGILVRGLFITLFLFLHSKLLDIVTSRLLNFHSAQLFFGGVAEFNILSSFLQPSIFGSFLLLSIYLFLKKQYIFAFLILPIVITVHPVYLLTCLLLQLSYTTILLSKPLKFQLLLINILILLCIIPVLSYGKNNFFTGDSYQKILIDVYFNFRIPHHSNPSVWLGWDTFFKIIAVIGSAFIARGNALAIIITIVFLGSLLLTLFQFQFNNSFLTFLIPWRASVLLVPLATMLILTKLVNLFSIKLLVKYKVFTICIFTMSILFASGVAITSYKFYLNDKYQNSGIINYIRSTTQKGDIYMVPVKIGEYKWEDFRLQTGTPILVDFKSHPFKPVEIVEWYERINLAHEFYSTNRCASLEKIIKTYHITHFITESSAQNNNFCGKYLRIFSSLDLNIYQIKK